MNKEKLINEMNGESRIEQIGEDCLTEEERTMPGGAVTIKRIIEQEHQEYVQCKEQHFELLKVLEEKRNEKKEYILKIKKQEDELKMLNIIIASQSQLIPLIANIEHPNLSRKSIDHLSSQLDKTETDIKEGQHLNENAAKCLIDMSCGIERYEKDVAELSNRNAILKQKLCNRSNKRQAEKIEIDRLKTAICTIDNEMKSQQAIEDKVNEDNKKYLIDLNSIISKGEEVEKKCLANKASLITMTEQFNDKMKLLEDEIISIDTKYEEINKIYEDEVYKTSVRKQEAENMSQEIKSLKIAITEKTQDREKLIEAKNAQLLKYNLLLKNTDNERLKGLLKSKIFEEENLKSLVIKCETEQNASENWIRQYEARARKLKQKIETRICDKLNITKRIEKIEIEITVNKEKHLKIERQLNNRKQAIAEKKITLNKLLSEKHSLLTILEGFQKKVAIMDFDHRENYLKILKIPSGAEIATLPNSDIIKQMENDKIKIETEISTLEKDIDNKINQQQGVTAECHLLTDKLAALHSQLTSLQEEREREKDHKLQLTVRANTSVDKDGDWDGWSDNSVQGAIPIQVAIRRYQQRKRKQRNNKRKNDE